MNIVFVFAKEVKTHFHRVTINVSGNIHGNRSHLANLLARAYHDIFPTFDMRDPEMMRHVDLCDPGVLMRTFMTAALVARSCPPDVAMGCTNINTIKNSIVIANKNIINRKRLLRTFKRNGNILLVDIIDGTPKPECIPYYDGIICCSQKAYEYYTQEYPRTPTYFVAHCTDPRIGPVTPPTDKLAPYYFGAPKNLLLFDNIKDMLSIVYTDMRDVPNHNWHKHLSESNFHYAVRPKMRDRVFKPFMKGIIAASCGVNMLVHKDDGDALHFLGEDYPYLIHEDISPDVVLRYMHKARDTFGKEEWKYGLERINSLRSIFSPDAIIRQFWDMIHSCTR